MKLLTSDFSGRVLLTGIFTAYGCFHLFGLWHLLTVNPRPDMFILDVIGRSSSFVFMVLATGFTVVRLPPKKESLGWMPRILAIAGTFMTLTLIVLPQVSIPPLAKLIATILVIVGTGLSAFCMIWLGRAFSIDAQARRLVTSGPYAIVRHPLYVCEAVTLLGVALGNLSVWSIAIVTVNLAVQYWRVVNEEHVLREAFPEYLQYAFSVPPFFPRSFAAR
jgi:protein-S-isoprenylcysteine O-methyltransferase Ste14